MPSSAEDWEAASKALEFLRKREKFTDLLNKPYALFIRDKDRISQVVYITHFFGSSDKIHLSLLTASGHKYEQVVSPKQSTCSIPGLILAELNHSLSPLIGLGGDIREVKALGVVYSYLPDNYITAETSNKGRIYYVSVEIDPNNLWEIHFNRYGQNGTVVQLLGNAVIPETSRW